ncbi:chromate transporter, chromate ion transporter (CHR) family protein [Psychromonas ingrahamii 37]|uniref:Chromate transporter, chromate ion transporter (CHR) family protein n=1 Tax=Psychromonas ingrahamii (strain DSM 17664 / CCUG 51855 / 37) TaxID=357804 RepID=A1SX52_PSYIN|nr:chromate efflux transporter [Psychromonas ingrahamii]ABM04067.1 chromate transporter, chromate ion transporter (CHR) family protein [Psychromonas ingrahamii 37]
MRVNTRELTKQTPPSLPTLFWIFLKIGSTAFGGFMALISVVKNYLVDREKLLTDEDMLDGISLATILPGPVAVNVVAYAGYRIRGVAGAITCATAVTLPSFFLILFLSYAYFTWGEIPSVSNIFKGILPAVAAVIVATSINMGRKALSSAIDLSIAVTAMLILIFIGGFYSTIIIIILAGCIGWLLFKKEILLTSQKEYPEKSTVQKMSEADKTRGQISKNKLRLMPIITVSGVSVVAILSTLFNAQTLLAGKLFATFAGMSVLLFGGGFVFIPLMQESVVETYQWVTHKEFIDAIAMGQITPGPILISATFIGYKVAGVLGATIATIGIFVPPAIIMLICTHYLERVKHSYNLRAILKGIRCAVIGMIASAAYIVSLSAEYNLISLAIFIVSIFALLKLKLEVVWIIPLAGITGLLAFT